MKNLHLLSFLLVFFLGLIACNLSIPLQPNLTNEEIYTAAAKTMIADFTEQAGKNSTKTVVGESPIVTVPSVTPQPSDTPTSTSVPIPTLVATIAKPSITPIPCNAVTFIKDVTIPDGTQLLAGSAFTKIWRLKNIGTCAWNSSYSVVFMSGNSMSGPVAFPLTSGVVAPNQVIDVSVNLVAPVSIGDKQGNWAIRSPEGVIFTLSTGPFWVKIKSVNIVIPTLIIPLPHIPQEMIAHYVSENSGAIKSNNTMLGFPNIGDDASNISFQGFLSFDISTIPETATITKVEIDFTDFNKLGSPYALGCLRVYKQSYGTLDIGDFFAGSPSGAVARFCDQEDFESIDEQPEMIAAIQEQLGHPRAKFRAQFNETATDMDAIADMIRLGPGLRLIITYTN